jgi:hypothetical protein
VPSAAIQLVQAGLFDRRALRELARRRESMGIISADASARIDPSHQTLLTANVELIAAALIGRSDG